MPYIPQEQRPPIDQLVAELAPLLDTPGKINYAITNLLLRKFEEEIRYHRLNELVGVLECVKLEFYTVQGRAYEDIAVMKNGPVRNLAL